MNAHSPAVHGPRRIIGQALIVLGSLALLASALTKLAGVPEVLSKLGDNGLTGGRVTFVALLEITSALLFLVPATRSAGLPMISAFMGGAIATHLQHGQSIGGPAVVLTLLWLGALLRHPETLWSLDRGARRAFGVQHGGAPAGAPQVT